MALRRFRVKSGNFSLRREGKPKQKFKRGEAFIAFDYQVPEKIRDCVEALEEISDEDIRKQYEPKDDPETKAKRGRPPKKDLSEKQEELRPIPVENGMWDVINVVADKKVNDKPLTVEEVAKLIEGFTGE